MRTRSPSRPHRSVSSSSDLTSSPKRTVLEPSFPPRPPTGHELMRGMLGWSEAPSWSTDVLGSLVLHGIWIEIALSPWKTAKIEGGPSKMRHSFLSIQCATGRWLNPEDLSLHGFNQDIHDLSPYTQQSDHREGGLMHVKGKVLDPSCWESLIKRFETLLAAIKEYSDMRKMVKLRFWCKRGKHRSYGLLIYFLMWASHVHDHRQFEALLRGPLERMQREAELVSTRSWQERVAFGDIVLNWEEHLNRKYPWHRDSSS